MEEKSKEELLVDMQNIALKMISIKSTIEEMLKEFETLEEEYFVISEKIKK